MDGYHKLARFMGQYDDCAIFKKFYDLNMQNLLYYQAEIISLKAEFNELAERDLKESDRSYHHRNWRSLSWSTNEEAMEQWEKWLEIREKLKEYNNALAQVGVLSKFKQPDSHNLAFLQNWLQRPGLGWGDFPLRGMEADSWESKEKSDLIAVNQREDSDPFTRWFTRSFIPLYHHSFRKTQKIPTTGEPISEFAYYPESHFLALVDIARTAIATLLPITSIITLYFVSSPIIRLALVIGFTIAFSLALILVMRGGRVEVFAATSAFAAIQVVFISGNGGFVS